MKYLDTKQLKVLESNSPYFITDNLQVIIGGDGILSDESRTIGNITGNTLGSNINFQGDSVKQINIQENPELDSALKELSEKINSIDNEIERDNANMYYEVLVRSIEQNKPNRIENCLKTLKDIIGAVASITKIAQQFAIIL